MIRPRNSGKQAPYGQLVFATMRTITDELSSRICSSRIDEEPRVWPR